MDIDSHFLNLGSLGLPKYLYRIISLDRFTSACAASQNTLVSPANWTDPYEAAQLRTQIEYPLFADSNGVLSSGLRDNVPRKVGGTWRTGTAAAKNVFCQCWSNLPESDAMWRLYSPTSMGVKLRARARALLTSLHQATASEAIFLGAVEYLTQDLLDALIRDVRNNHLLQRRPERFERIPGEAWARCLLRKREQFKHESEYRLILANTDRSKTNESGSLLNYAFNFNECVDEIELDPRSDTAAVGQTLREAGYTGPVKRSKLYEPPTLIVRPSWPEDEGWSIGGERKWLAKEDE